MLSTFLSPHFTLEEAIQSNVGERYSIDNTPSDIIRQNVAYTAVQMENVRNILNNDKIVVNSWYRCLELNRLIGGTANSQHLEGLAVDFICPDFGDPMKCCEEIQQRKLFVNYDQLIYEYSWIHISFVRDHPRGQELSKNKKDFVLGIKQLA